MDTKYGLWIVCIVAVVAIATLTLSNIHFKSSNPESIGQAIKISDMPKTPAYSCGNSVIENFEECDGSNLDGKTCEFYGQGYIGSLECNNCKLDPSGCYRLK